MGEKISIRPIELKYQKPTDTKDCYIEFFDTYLKYKIEFNANEPIIEKDEDSVWEDVQSNYEWLVMKRNIAGLEKSLTKDNKWAVRIIINGFGNDINTYFRSQERAQILFDKIQNWLILIPE